MGTQGTGRKRSTKKDKSTAEDDALNLIAREAEARLAAKRAARAEAREIRMKELERQQKELSDDDERMSVGSRGSVKAEDGNYLEKGSRAASALTSTTLTSLGGTSSRRGSGETALTLDAETSIREIKDKLTEVEEKYRKAMVSNAQLDNEKNNLMYQVDTLKDSLMELEELLAESRRECEDKVKEFEREKYAHGVLQFQFNELKETLKQSEELLNEIRQLRLKEEGFHNEISDLQETVEWKDKKISALERQKEYTDAIRVERDELREEVVKLKDILKKHGIVLGPDLNINGEVEETNTEESPSGDSPSQPSQESPLSPTEGNSMLGNTEEEKETRNDRKEETKPEQSQETHDVNEESQFENICNGTEASKVGICVNEEQEYHKRESVMELSEAIGTNLHETETTPEEKLFKSEPFEQKEMDNQELQETGAAIKPTSEDQVDKLDEVDSVQVIKAGAEQTENVIKEDVSDKDAEKESITTECVPAASKNEPQQDPEAVEDGANEENEDGSVSKTQGTSAAGKKKKRKKRGKKKRAGSEERKEDDTEAEKDAKKQETQTGSDVKSASGGATEELSTEPHDETVTESEQINKDINSVDANKETTEQFTEHADPPPVNVKDEHMSLTEKGTLVEVNTTRLETESVRSPEAALSTSHIDKSQSTDKMSSLDNATPKVESEVGTEIHVAHIDKSERNEHANVIESTENDFTDGLPRPSVIKSESDDSIEERGTEDGGESCSIESEQPSSINTEEVNKEDIDLNEGLADSESPKLEEKHENEGIETEESPKLQHVGQTEDSTCDVSVAAEAFDEAAIIQTTECDTANEINSIEADKNGENMAHKDDREQEKSENDPESEACHAVEAQPECSSDVKETEAVLTSGQLNPLEEEAEVGIQVSPNKSSISTDNPIKPELQQATNVENEASESTVENDTESETCPELNPEAESEAEQCRPMEQDSDKEEEEYGEGLSFDFDDIEMEAAIASEGLKRSEEEVEVGVEVLPDEGNGKEEPIKTEAETQNVDGKELGSESAAGSFVGEVVKRPEEPTSEGATEEPPVEGVVQNSSENNNKLSAPAEEGLDVVKHERQSKEAVVPKSRQDRGSESEPPQSGKDTKKNSKKGKGKGKDDCKMT